MKTFELNPVRVFHVQNFHSTNRACHLYSALSECSDLNTLGDGSLSIKGMKIRLYALPGLTVCIMDFLPGYPVHHVSACLHYRGWVAMTLVHGGLPWIASHVPASFEASNWESCWVACCTGRKLNSWLKVPPSFPLTSYWCNREVVHA